MVHSVTRNFFLFCRKEKSGLFTGVRQAGLIPARASQHFHKSDVTKTFAQRLKLSRRGRIPCFTPFSSIVAESVFFL